MADKSSDTQQSTTSQQAGAAGAQPRQGSGQTASQTTSRERSGQQQGTRGSSALQRRSATPMVGAFGLSPFSLMRRMMEDMDRLFEGFGGGRAVDVGPMPGLPSSRGLSVWSPAIEVLERDGNVVIRADLPGLSPDDVRIEATDDSLVIEGERRSELEAEEEGVYRSERTYGRFSREVPLPEGADPQKAQARFENGVLEVTIPLAAESSRRRRIEIQRGAGQQRTSSEPSVH